jgi:hypothetical protein
MGDEKFWLMSVTHHLAHITFWEKSAVINGLWSVTAKFPDVTYDPLPTWTWAETGAFVNIQNAQHAAMHHSLVRIIFFLLNGLVKYFTLSLKYFLLAIGIFTQRKIMQFYLTALITARF